MSEEQNKLDDQVPAESEASESSEGAVASPVDEVTENEAAESVVADGAEAEVATDEEAVATEEAEDLADESAAEEESAEEEEVEEDEEDEPVADADPAKEVAEEESDDSIKMDWYILKVQSNRERSITDALRRKIAIEGLDEYFGEVVVPVEKVTEFKSGKKKIVERKLYPGYIVVHMHINDDTWFAVRETSGIGDFTGSGGKPTPMLPHEVARIIQKDEEETDDTPKLDIAFNLGDQVKVKEGTFESFEGEVHAIDEHSGRVTVMINIFGRSTPVELEYWQAEQV